MSASNGWQTQAAHRIGKEPLDEITRVVKSRLGRKQESKTLEEVTRSALGHYPKAFCGWLDLTLIHSSRLTVVIALSAPVCWGSDPVEAESRPAQAQSVAAIAGSQRGEETRASPSAGMRRLVRRLRASALTATTEPPG